jgi:hypothetical protein
VKKFLIGCGLAVLVALAVIVGIFIYQWNNTTWDGEMAFRVIEDPNDRGGRFPDPDFVDVAREPGDGAEDPFVEVGNDSIPVQFVPQGTRVGDVLVCKVHQEHAFLTQSRSDSTVTIGPCRPR